MFVTIGVTAVTLHLAFGWAGLTPSGGRAVGEVVRFALDYTFWLNLVMAGLATWLIWLSRRAVSATSHRASGGGGGQRHGDPSSSMSPKRIAALCAVAVLVAGALAWLLLSTNQLSP
jgi:hypothetical protein